MFASDPGCLRVISTIYGEKAIEALASMGVSWKEMITAGHTFDKPRYNSTRFDNMSSNLVDGYLNRLETPITIGGTKVILNAKRD